jgi:hypothetical protein
MSQKFLVNIDLVQNQIKNGRFETVATDPTTENFEGRLIYNSTEKVLKWYDGTAWRKTVYHINSNTTALTTSESNGSVALSIADAVSGGASGLLTGADKQKLDNATSSPTATTLALRDASGRLQVATPVAADDAANKGYVDAARAGLDVKDSVRAATTTNITLSAPQTIDGVSVIAGDRVLVKDQNAGETNGIYVVAAGAWQRSEDANVSAEVTAGMFTFVEEGTVNGDSGFVLTTNNPITLGTTPLVFAQFSGAGQIVAGGGLTKSGNTLDVGGTANRITINTDSVDIASTYVGQTSITTVGTIGTGTWAATDVAIEHGGTGASTAGGARTNLAGDITGGTTSAPALSRVAAQTITGSATEFDIDHNFNTRDVIVQVFDNATWETVVTDVIRSTVNRVKILFSVAPGSAEYRVVVTG